MTRFRPLSKSLPGTLFGLTRRRFASCLCGVPYIARGQRLDNATWNEQYQNKKRSTGEVSGKTEANVTAGKVLAEALGVARPKPRNWTVCHIWGYDDPSFAEGGNIARDPLYYSCIANMIWLPTRLKSFTDSLPEVKAVLRTCAFYLYGWACEHESVKEQATAIRAGEMPKFYPKDWPTRSQKILPLGTATYDAGIEAAIVRRKRKIKELLADESRAYFPHEQVRKVVAFWKIAL